MDQIASRQVGVGDMAGDERRSIEHLLGHALQEDQQVYILAFKPGAIPDDDTRRRALASMRRRFAATERYALGQGITDAQIDEAVDEIVDQIRYGKP